MNAQEPWEFPSVFYIHCDLSKTIINRDRGERSRTLGIPKCFYKHCDLSKKIINRDRGERSRTREFPGVLSNAGNTRSKKSRTPGGRGISCEHAGVESNRAFGDDRLPLPLG